jgi:hypothetical protein
LYRSTRGSAPLGPVPDEEVAYRIYTSIYDMTRYTLRWRADILRAKSKGRYVGTARAQDDWTTETCDETKESDLEFWHSGFAIQSERISWLNRTDDIACAPE